MPRKFYLIAASIMIVKMMSRGWITVFRMIKVNRGFHYPEAEQRACPSQSDPRKLLPNEYVGRSRQMHSNDVENILLFLAADLLYVFTQTAAPF